MFHKTEHLVYALARLPPFIPTSRGRLPPLPEPGSAGSFFLLRQTFPFPLSPKHFLIGSHTIVGFLGVCIIVRSTLKYTAP